MQPSSAQQESDPTLDPARCRRARVSRDPRFDGEFYVAVRSTGIYCRPVCPARTPAEKNVTYFRHASQAAQAGFRPCLRCRPESAPTSPAWAGTSTTVRRALQLIAEGALNEAPLASLAERLGVGERYLRKLFARELGVPPAAVAQNQRLLFARKLVMETGLPMTEIAFAAGFGSVRRFNSAMREQFRMTPGNLRRRNTARDKPGTIALNLSYRPPYDFDGVMGLFARHAIEGVEEVTARRYKKRVRLARARTEIAVSHIPARHALRLEIALTDPLDLMPIVARVRRMFDLDANPAAIAAVLGTDRALQPLVAANPGVRSPSYWSLFEASVRAIAGQQVSTAAAKNVLHKLAQAAQPGGGPLLFPTAAQLSRLADAQFPMPGRRRETLRAVCRHYQDREESMDLEALGKFPGIGPWTVAMVAMRGMGQSDLFVQKDLGLEKAWAQLTDDSAMNLGDYSMRWRPWGAYAANLLWRSLTP